MINYLNTHIRKDGSNNPWPPPLLKTSAAMVLGVSLTAPASAALINLTNDTSFNATDLSNQTSQVLEVPLSSYVGIDNQSYRGAIIGDAVLVKSNEGSGSGQYRRLFQTPDTGGNIDVTQGYNRDVGGDFLSSTFSNPGADIRIEDLAVVSDHYIFALDTNQPQASVNSYISIDELQVYVGGSVDPSPLPSTVGDLADLGMMVWDLQGSLIDGTRNDVMLDSGLSTGAGTDSMMLALPVSLFEGFAPDSLVYLYAKHGELGTDDSQRGESLDGFEYSGGGFLEWAVYTDDNFDPDDPISFTPPIPEPSTTLLLLSATLPVLLRRRRS